MPARLYPFHRCHSPDTRESYCIKDIFHRLPDVHDHYRLPRTGTVCKTDFDLPEQISVEHLFFQKMF